MKKIFGLFALLLPMLFGIGISKSSGFAGNFNNAIVAKAEETYTKEDFIEDWYRIVRRSDDFDPCGSEGLTRSQYQTIKNLLAKLSQEDQDYVLSQNDGNTGNTIQKTFQTLETIFSGTPVQSRGDNEITQSAAVGIILTVSIVGMTAICIFYIFKTKEIID